MQIRPILIFLKSILKRLVAASLIFLFISLILVVLITGNVKSDLINYTPALTSENVDTLLLHFIHGSKPEKGCIYNKRRIGSYLGGHVELELNQKVFGFIFDSLPINTFPKIKKNSKYEVRSKNDWATLSKHDRITTIYIPIDSTTKNKIVTYLSNYLFEEPYDYALFGHRCTSSAAKLLSDVGVINKFSNIESIISFFYPRNLRFIMLKFANKNKYKVSKQNGIECHIWE